MARIGETISAASFKTAIWNPTVTIANSIEILGGAGGDGKSLKPLVPGDQLNGGLVYNQTSQSASILGVHWGTESNKIQTPPQKVISPLYF